MTTKPPSRHTSVKNSLKTSSVSGAISSVIEGIFETFRRALVEYDDGRVLEMVFGVTHGNGPRDYKRAMLSSDRDDWVEILSKKMGLPSLDLSVGVPRSKLRLRYVVLKLRTLTFSLLCKKQCDGAIYLLNLVSYNPNRRSSMKTTKLHRDRLEWHDSANN